MYIAIINMEMKGFDYKLFYTFLKTFIKRAHIRESY